MDKSLENLLTECQANLQIANQQKIKNVTILGEVLQKLLQAFQAQAQMTPNNVIELKCNRHLHKNIKIVIELYRCLTIQDENELQGIQLEKMIYDGKEYDIPLVNEESEFKRRQKLNSLLVDLNQLDVFSIKQSAIEFLDKFDYSIDGPLSPRYISRYSLLAYQLLSFVIGMKCFCKQLLQVKSQINLEYAETKQSIQSLQSYLDVQNPQLELIKNGNSINNIVEVQIQTMLSSIKDKLVIKHLDSDFISFFRLNVDFRVWIQNKRPLIIWQMFEVVDTNKKLEELAQYYKYHTVNEIPQPYRLGFDFLLLLNQSELRQISSLKLEVSGQQDIQKICPYLKNLKYLSLKSLKLSYQIFDYLCSEKQLRDSLIEFLVSQTQIEELQLTTQSGISRDNLMEVLASIKIFSNLKKLTFITENNFPIEQTQQIFEIIQSFRSLEYLHIGFDSYLLDDKLKDIIENVRLPTSLKCLKLQQKISDLEAYELFIPSISELKSLQELRVEFRYNFDQAEIHLLKNITKNIPNLPINKLQLNFEEPHHQLKDVIKKIYKLKRIVDFIIYPCLNQY